MAVLAALAACERAAPVPPLSRPPLSDAAELKAAGDARLRQGDDAGALAAYEAALERAPGDVGLRYLVGVVLTRLDRPEAAATVFREVVNRGPEGLEEVRLARQWLAEPADAAAAPREAQDDGVGSGPSSPREALGGLEGETRWTRLERGHPSPRLKILLVGGDQGTEGRRYAARTVLNQPYRFDGVEPGTYRLVAQVGMIRLWDMPVTVPRAGTARVDLTEAAAVAPADALLLSAS